MKILCIGNSFSEDATRYIHQIARADGYKMKVVNLYIGGCSFSQHFKNIMAKHAGKRSTYIFMFAMLCIPIIFFIVFNVGVKVNSVLLSLKYYDKGVYKFLGNGNLFVNFKQVFYDLSNNYEVKMATKNSFIFYGVSMLVIMPLSVFTSYFIYKKKSFWDEFRFFQKLFFRFLFRLVFLKTFFSQIKNFFI